MTTPTFVVVGHVNRGKSSMVSTLAADESVKIGPTPGTTKECRRFPMRIGGEVIYELIDSPGFERPRAVLQWLEERETSTGKRPDVVRQFVTEHEHGDRFRQECELLGPVLAGAAILYVIDSSVPFSPSSEAEMKILQWTGQPRMALINMTGGEDYTAQWRPVLDQYFRLIRDFNAHRASFVDRVKLIRSLREIHEPWEPALNKAIEALIADRRHSTRDAADEIAEMLARLLTLTLNKKLPSEGDVDSHKNELGEKYRDELRRIEKKSHRSMEDIYHRARLVVEHEDLQSNSEDLFSEGTWTQLGLSRNQLAMGSAGAGAIAGGMIDASVGGASFLMGSIIGAASGAAIGYFGVKRLATVKILNQPLGGKLLTIGPMKNPNFPWIVLDRALAHHAIVANCPHAKREVMHARGDATAAHRTANWPADTRKPYEKLFGALRKNAGREVNESLRKELAELIARRLEEIEDLERLI